MAQDNRGYYPTDSLNQEQTEFYNEYPSYQYNNETNHYHDEESDQVVEKSVYVNYSNVNINGTIGSRGSPSRSSSGFPLRDSPLIRVNPNPAADHSGPQYRGAHFAYHEDNFINMHHKHSLLQPQYNTYGLPRKSASNPLLRIPSDLMSSSPAPKPAPLQNARNGGNNTQQKQPTQKPDSMEDFSRDLEAELNKLLQDDGDDDSTASLQESDSISRSHLSSTNSSRGNLFSPFITDAGSQTEDEAVTPNGVIYDPYWEAQASPSNHSSSGLVPRAASWGQLNTSSLYVNVNGNSDELGAMNSPHRIALSPQTRNLGLGSRSQGPGMNSGHQRSASLGTVNIKNMTPASQLVTPLITPPSTTPPQSLTLSNDLFDPLDSSSDSNTRLFFKALPPELDNYPFLLQTFIKYGDVKSLTCNSKRRFALVEFGTRDEAMLAKRECKKIQGPSGEVYRLKIFWGKDFVDIKQRKSKGSLSPSHSPNQHPDMLNHVMYNQHVGMDEHLIGAPPNMPHYPGLMSNPWYHATPAYSDGL